MLLLPNETENIQGENKKKDENLYMLMLPMVYGNTEHRRK